MTSLLGRILLFGGVLSCSTAAACLLVRALSPFSKGKLEKLRVIAERAVLLACGFFVSSLLLLFACFAAGDLTVLFVAENVTDELGMFGLLLRVSGVWSGRQGSIFTWAVALSLFAAGVSRSRMAGSTAGSRPSGRIGDAALLVICLILLAFASACCPAGPNDPFMPTPDYLLEADGSLSEAAIALGFGMGDALKHWALAFHPPFLFVGYAGLAVPFSYATAALATGELTSGWSRAARPYALIALFAMTIGILFGSIWAAESAGWGGYWSWDPIESASLLPWLACVGFLHSTSMYDRDSSFAKMAVLFAVLCLAFVLMSTFIARSGYVGTVHAYTGKSPALLTLPVVAIILAFATVAGIFLRRDSFAPRADGLEGLLPSGMYIGNAMTLATCLVMGYAICAPSLPEWMPLGGLSVSSAVYSSIASTLGLLAVSSLVLFGFLAKRKVGVAAAGRKSRDFKAMHVAAACVIAGFVASQLFVVWWAVWAVWLGGALLAISFLMSTLRNSGEHDESRSS